MILLIVFFFLKILYANWLLKLYFLYTMKREHLEYT